MGLPIFLPYGLVSIYGLGDTGSYNEMQQGTDYRWGNVDAVSQYGITWVIVGQEVLFKESDVEARLAYSPDNTTYTLVPEVKLVCRAYPPLP